MPVPTRIGRNGVVQHQHSVLGYDRVRTHGRFRTSATWHDASLFHRTEHLAHERNDVVNPTWVGRYTYQYTAADATRMLERALLAHRASGLSQYRDMRQQYLPELRVRQPDHPERPAAPYTMRQSRSGPSRRRPQASTQGRRTLADAAAALHAERIAVEQQAQEPNGLRRFGVEIEFLVPDLHAFLREMNVRGLSCNYEGYTHVVTGAWKVVTDGSVSGARAGNVSYSGYELVSPVLRGESGMDQLRRACEALVAAHCVVNRNCGLHVHQEARDMTVPDVIRLIEGYVGAQGALDSVMPPSRRSNGSNSYCRPYTYEMLSTLRRCQSFQDVARTLTDRYRVVNFQSYPRYGTIEFRQHSGSIEFAKIAAWVRFTAAAMDTARAQRSFGEQLEAVLENLGLGDSDRNYFIRRAAHFIQPRIRPANRGLFRTGSRASAVAR